MSNTRVKPILEWDTEGRWLLWDHLALVTLEKTERDEKAYYKLKYPEFMAALAEGGFPDMEVIWEDVEADEENFDLYMKDDGNVHERLKEIYEQIITDLPYEVLATESTPECNGENTQPSRTMKLKSTQQEVIFEAVEHSNGMKAIQYLKASDHDKVLVIAGRFFSVTVEEANKVIRSGLQMAIVGEVVKFGKNLCRIITVPINENGEVPTIDSGQPVPPNENESNDVSNESETQFTDKFFQVTRRPTCLILGNDHKDIFKHITPLDLRGSDCCRLMEASGIQAKSDWFIGVFNEPVVVCGQCYPEGTLAVFQSKEPGSRFALFSFEDGDEVM